ncbi:MAG: chemotaxis protein [Gammaproteobacteria bacterium]
MAAIADAQPKDLFASTATVVAHLEGVRQIANEISLAAANAKAVAARAGNRASGFVPITNFIDEMGRETRRLVDRVNQDAQRMVRSMLAEQRLGDALDRLRKGMDRLEQGSSYLDGVARDLAQEHQVASEATRRHLDSLCDLLVTITDHARAARMMSTRSRVEATIAGDYQVSLESVADTVDNAAEHIRDVVMRCRALLRSMY